MAAVPLLLRQASARGETGAASPTRVLMWLALAALAVSVIARAFIGLNTSFWLDETWTGAFASEKSVLAVTRQIRNDANAPLYYYLLFFWSKVFGLSNLALRLPSVLFSLATPVVAWAALRSRWPALALTWGALLALWMPGVELSGYARGYTLLALAATVNLAAYLRVLEAPTLKRALAWVASASLAVLVHYHAAFLALAEAVIFLAAHRRRALAVWPAGLAAAPAFAWIAWHAPRLMAFARPDVAWYDKLTLADLPRAIGFLAGSTLAWSVIATALAIGVLLARRGASDQDEAKGSFQLLWLAGGAAALGVAACLTVAAIRPSFTVRYLTPFVPGVLLLVACGVHQLARGRSEPPAVLIGGFIGVAVLWMVQIGSADRGYSFEKASAFIRAARPDRLAFFWDNPATAVEAPDQLDRVGGFFLRRAGWTGSVAPLYTRPGRDMTTAALDAAGPRGAILWLYDTSVHGTRATTASPRIAAVDPHFNCRNFGAGPIGVIACRRGGAS